MNQLASYPLRLPRSMKEALVKAAERDGISMNQFITIAVAEKLAAMDTARLFEERSERADFERFRQVLNRSGGEGPKPGDELS